MQNRKVTSEDRQFQSELEQSLKVSSYLPEIFDALVEKRPVQQGFVPDYGMGNNGIAANEMNSLVPMDLDYLVQATTGGAESLIQSEEMPYVTKQASKTPKAATTNKYAISRNQYNAINNYPALVEFLGTALGEKIAEAILYQVNEILAQKVGKNSQEIQKLAQSCVADRQNIKQYFVGPDQAWVCVVTANGPFRGDEAIYYDPQKNRSAILRKNVQNEYDNVSSLFNIIHEVVEKNAN